MADVTYWVDISSRPLEALLHFESSTIGDTVVLAYRDLLQNVGFVILRFPRRRLAAEPTVYGADQFKWRARSPTRNIAVYFAPSTARARREHRLNDL